jgi:hypothetical protein
MQDAFRYQAVYRIARFKGWIQLNQWIGPQKPGVQFLLNPLVDLPVANLYEASDVGRVVPDQLPPNFESVHDVSLANGISWASNGGSTDVSGTLARWFDCHIVLYCSLLLNRTDRLWRSVRIRASCVGRTPSTDIPA